MRIDRHSHKFLLALAALAVAQPGHAGALTDCIAANMPAESRQEAVDSYVKGGFAQMKPPQTAVLSRLAGACLPRAQKSDKDLILRFSALIVADLSASAGEVALARHHGLAKATIDLAWAQLSPVHRARFGRAGKSDAASTNAMIAFAGTLRPEIPLATLEGLRASADGNEPLKALIPFITDATLYGMSRGLLETDR